jgi:pimeloyl-ACP methyl ester carboxylesterase
VKLAATVQGEGPPLVIAHGLFGSGRNWGVIARRLAEGRQVFSVDMRNHGDSPWSDDHSYAALAEDLAGVAPHPFDVVGHSMGGKAAMMLALTQPEAVRSLVAVDIAPVAYGHTQMPLIEAMQAADLSRIERRSDVPLEVEDDATRAFLLQSCDVAERRWRLNLGALAANMESLVGWPDAEGRFDGPALFLRGGASPYVRDESLPAIRRLFPAARVETIEGAGHWLHAERPREVETAIRRFLDAQGTLGEKRR